MQIAKETHSGLNDMTPLFEHTSGDFLLALTGGDFICLKEMFEVACKKICERSTHNPENYQDS